MVGPGLIFPSGFVPRQSISRVSHAEALALAQVARRGVQHLRRGAQGASAARDGKTRTYRGALVDPKLFPPVAIVGDSFARIITIIRGVVPKKKTALKNPPSF